MSADNYLVIIKFAEDRFAVAEGRMSFPGECMDLHAVFKTENQADKYTAEFERENIVEYGTEFDDYNGSWTGRTPSSGGGENSYFAIYKLRNNAYMLTQGNMKRFGESESIINIYPSEGIAQNVGKLYIEEFGSHWQLFEGLPKPEDA